MRVGWRSGALQWLVAVSVLLAFSLVLGDFYRHLGMTVLIMALFALSYNLLLGGAGLVSFGHAAFFGVGGYTYALLATKAGTPALLNIIFAPLVTALIAFLVGYFCVRLHGILFSMLTLAFGQVIYTVTFQWYSFTGGDNGIVGLPAPALLIPPGNYYIFVVLAVVLSGFMLWRLVHSPFGQALRIMRENRERAGFIGIPVRRLRLIVFTIAGGFAGIAGLLFALLNRQVFPDDMYWAQTAQVLVMSLLGGIFTFLGPAVGALIVTVLQYWIATYTIYWLLILGIILLLCVLFFPRGIVGSLQERFRHRLAPPPSSSPIPNGRVSISDFGLKNGGILLKSEIRNPQSTIGHRGGGGSRMKALLSVQGLAKSFGGLRAVDGVDLEVRQGEITAIIGPNGAGKTTFFNLISGAFPCDRGRIVFNGEEVTNLPAPRLFKEGIGRAFQVVNLFPRLTVFENVQAVLLSRQGKIFNGFLSAERLARQETERVLTEVGLADKASVVSRNLSHGDQKRLDIAIALAARPRLLLLDEPTAGLNPKESREIMGLVEGIARREGLTVIFIEHDMDVVFSAAEIIRVMHQGRLIAEGTPQEIRGHPEVRKIYLGEEA